MRVLISAYACEPEKGSEPGVGWNWVRQIARFHDVWVITRANNRGPILESLTSKPLPNVQWVYFDLPHWARFWKKGSRGLHAYYCFWQLGVYFVARKLHREVGFDLAHHVTFVNYWMPSFLALLPVPFLWGPVGGGESAPPAFWSSFSLQGKVSELARDLGRKMAECNPFLRNTARRAALGLATTEETAKRMRRLGCRWVSLHSEAGLSQEDIEHLSSMPLRRSKPFRLLSLGRLLHWKGFELGLRAFAEMQCLFPASEYWVIGEGPEEKRLRTLAQKLGLAEKVTFWGQLPRARVMERLAECDVLLHPSLHDSGGWVCLEAMAAGRPVICLDLGGPALQITEETGIKVRATTPEQVVHDLADALYRLAISPELRARCSFRAKRRAKEHFNWDKKGPTMAKVYKSLSTVQEGSLVERCHTAKGTSPQDSLRIGN